MWENQCEKENSTVKMEDTCKCKYIAGITLSCLIGLMLSMYAVHVELHTEIDHDYKAMCDISEKISCTKVFSSRYGKGFGLIGPILGEDSVLNVPNGIMGVIFYFIIAALSFINNLKASKAQVILSVISNILSLYLAYLLYFVLEDLCVVCVGTYAVNLANFYFSMKRYRALEEVSMDSMDEIASTVDDMKKLD